MIDKKPNHDYTRNILIQMFVVFLLLFLMLIWQRDVVYKIYVNNQINKVGYAVNGGIFLLFIFGLFELIKRFYSYRNEELSIQRFLKNVNNGEEPLLGIRQDYMVAKRFLILKSLNRRQAYINQNALAATLLASESSRNSFLRFIHNTLILTGIFGTIISLSISLLGASDLIQSSSSQVGVQKNGLGTIMYGMSTALSTTMTAIITYLFFSYFYIKLTDTQTYLISKVEEVTATTLLPHIQINQDAVVKNYFESINIFNELIKKLDQSQKIYTESVKALQRTAKLLTANLELEKELSPLTSNEELIAAIHRVIQIQQQVASQNSQSLEDIITLLQRGFRLRSK